MEDELLAQLDKEEQLLFSRKVTLEGLQMFVSVVHSGAEEDVQTFLPALHSKLLKVFGGIQITSSPLSAGDAKPAELLELEQNAAPLVPVVVDTALKFFLEELEQENKSEGASAEIGKLLSNSADPCLSQFGRIAETFLLEICTVAARVMVKAIYKRFDECSKSFHQKDYDESTFSARDTVISAIQHMDREGQTAATSQAHCQLCTSEELEEGLLEKREAVGQAITLVQTEISQELFDGLPWNLVQTFMEPMNPTDFGVDSKSCSYSQQIPWKHQKQQCISQSPDTSKLPHPVCCSQPQANLGKSFKIHLKCVVWFSETAK